MTKLPSEGHVLLPRSAKVLAILSGLTIFLLVLIGFLGVQLFIVLNYPFSLLLVAMANTVLEIYLTPMLLTASLIVASVTLYRTHLKGPDIRLLDQPQWTVSLDEHISDRLQSTGGKISEEGVFSFQNRGSTAGAIFDLKLVLTPSEVWREYSPNRDVSAFVEMVHGRYFAPTVTAPIPREGLPLTEWPYLVDKSFPIMIPAGGFVFFRFVFQLRPSIPLPRLPPTASLDDAVRSHLGARRESLERWLAIAKTQAKVGDIVLTYEVTTRSGRAPPRRVPFGCLEISKEWRRLESSLVDWEQRPPTPDRFVDVFLEELNRLKDRLLALQRQLGAIALDGSSTESLPTKGVENPYGGLLRTWKPTFHEKLTDVLKKVSEFNAGLDRLKSARRDSTAAKSRMEENRKTLHQMISGIIQELTQIKELS